ncbi:MAG: GtrA family protein [Oscillospiraceae bacterium]|nr:GtrA family protein [Oscillospiraceae bacterium]
MARNFATKEGAKVQAYCMYVKLLQRAFGGKVPPDAAGAFNQCFLSYFLNKYFTFQSRDNSVKGILKFTVNITACYLLAYGAAKPLIRLLFSGLPGNWQDNIAMLAGMCIFVFLNYCGQRFFVFRKSTV